MAVVIKHTKLLFSASLNLNQAELRAMEALVLYGDDAFIEAFKEKLGSSYIRDHEAGLRSVFAAIRRDVLPAIKEIDFIQERLAREISNDGQ